MRTCLCLASSLVAGSACRSLGSACWQLGKGRQSLKLPFPPRLADSTSVGGPGSTVNGLSSRANPCARVKGWCQKWLVKGSEAACESRGRPCRGAAPPSLCDGTFCTPLKPAVVRDLQDSLSARFPQLGMVWVSFTQAQTVGPSLLNCSIRLSSFSLLFPTSTKWGFGWPVQTQVGHHLAVVRKRRPLSLLLGASHGVVLASLSLHLLTFAQSLCYALHPDLSCWPHHCCLGNSDQDPDCVHRGALKATAFSTLGKIYF